MIKHNKTRKADIVVGIPSYNEHDSISKVTRKIDEGLRAYFPDYKSLIVNVDGNSEDRTVEVFNGTATSTSKLALRGGSTPRGKGANIFRLLELAHEVDAAYVCMFDADTVSISEEWPKRVLQPMIDSRADFVAPVYTRNRYEGNTTNHFCYPLMNAWFGGAISQPIGGDFGMNAAFIRHLTGMPRIRDSFLYGIDIFLTVHAMGGQFTLEEVYLGRKIHKPSFDKINPIFLQAASTMFYTLSKYKDVFSTSIVRCASDVRMDSSFVRVPTSERQQQLMTHAQSLLHSFTREDTDIYLGISQKFVDSLIRGRPLESDEWVALLKASASYTYTHEIDDEASRRLAALLSPFYFLRVLSYFEELKDQRANPERIINAQTQKLASAFAEIRRGS